MTDTKPIQLIVSDLDGTLLSAEQQVEQYVLDTIEQFRATGGLFTIATGRPYITAKPIIQQLNIDLPVILCNGAVIMQHDQVIEKHSFPLTLLAPMLEEAYRLHLSVLIFCEHHIYVFGTTPDVMVYEQKEIVTCQLLSLSDPAWLELEAEKIILIGDVSLASSLWAQQSGVVNEQFVTFQSEVNYLEIVSSRCSKGNALETVANLLDITRQEIMAIGNERNDLPMFTIAQIGAAVANSGEALKQQADYICKESYGRGVVEAMKKFGCIK